MEVILQTDRIKFVGQTVDEHFNWTDLSKESSCFTPYEECHLFAIYQHYKVIYFAYNHSIIYVRIVPYGATSKRNLDSMLKIQETIEIILQLGYNDLVNEHLLH